MEVIIFTPHWDWDINGNKLFHQIEDFTIKDRKIIIDDFSAFDLIRYIHIFKVQEKHSLMICCKLNILEINKSLKWVLREILFSSLHYQIIDEVDYFGNGKMVRLIEKYAKLLIHSSQKDCSFYYFIKKMQPSYLIHHHNINI